MENQQNVLTASVLAILIEAGDGIRLGDAARKNADKKHGGAYDTIMRAAAEAGTLEVFEAACKELFDGIRKNVVRDEAPKGLAVLFGAEHGTDKDGKPTETYTVPHSLSRCKTTVKKAFSNNVSLTDEEGNPRTWNSVNEENKEIAKADREAAEAPANLTGDDLTRAEIAQALSLIMDRSKKATGSELAEIHSVVMALSGMAQSDDDDDDSESDSGHELAAVANG